MIGAVAPILPSQKTARLCAAIFDRRDTIPAPPFSTAVNIATAYERNSLIVTTNLPFENWTDVLGSERLTSAALDSLTQRCHILETKGESYRLQDAKRRRRRTY